MAITENLDPHVNILNGDVSSAELWSSRLEVCPDCYTQRDQAVPLFNIAYVGGGYTAYLPSGERLRPMKAIQILACLACCWSEVKEHE